MYFVFQEILVSALLQVNKAPLKQVRKFKYLGVAFSSDERQDEELGIGTGMQALHYSVVVKRELLKNGKDLKFQNSFCLHSLLLYLCYELFVMCTQNHHLHVNTCKFIVKVKPNLIPNSNRMQRFKKKCHYSRRTSKASFAIHC